MLMLSGFRVLAERATVELAARGHDDVRPVHDFALRAIASGADNASELGRRMSVTKQAAAKTIAALEVKRYVAREADVRDGRRRRLHVTDHGFAMLSEGEQIFDELRRGWEDAVGVARLADMESVLRALVDSGRSRGDPLDGATHDLAE